MCKIQGRTVCMCGSTDELQDGHGFVSKIAPFGKDYLPSITGLLTSPYECWSLDSFRSKEDTSDEFHEQDHSSSRIQSSEEEEKETRPSTFAALLSSDPMPTPFIPTPEPEDPVQQESFSALLSSVEPVMSSQASWVLPGEEDEEEDNWHRTAPRYSRKDDATPVKSTSWYHDEDPEHDPRAASKFSDPIMSNSLDDGPRPKGHNAIKMLTKNINSIKRKIKRFEEEFERTFGYRPSHSDKMKHKEIKKYVSDLSKAKKELKQMKDDIPEKKVRSFPKTSPCSISLLRCQEATEGGLPSQIQDTNSQSSSRVTKDTFRQMEDRLSAKRCEAGRPLKVADLTLDQLKEEKTDIQKALLFYESLHGRPSTREDKDLVRPLYDRYRLVKRSVSKISARSKENVIELAPILEHVVMDFTLASPQHRGSLEDEDNIAGLLGSNPSDPTKSPFTFPIVNPDPHPEVVPTPPPAELNLGDLHALPIHELKERKKEARDQKRRLRHSLRDLEEQFERETGRKMQKEDRGPLEKDYNEYKHVKAKLRLLEALLSKHDS